MTKTFLAKNSNSLTLDRAAFTLVELLVVVALISLVTLVALPQVNSIFKLSLATTAREISTSIREGYNSAIMTGQVHRIVYDLKKNEYWVEMGPVSFLLDTSSSKEEDARRKKFSSKKKEGDQTEFAIAKTITRKKIALPRGVEFDDIMTEQSTEPLTEGLAFTHFFPHGIAEQTLVHLKDTSNHKSTLIITALVGKTRVIERYVDKKEAFEF